MNRLISRIVSGLLLLLASLSPVHAQSKGAADANAAAYEIYSTGDYKAAAAIYEKLLKDYPTDGIVSSVQLQLAFCYYFLSAVRSGAEHSRKGRVRSAAIART